ncbi:hypothetical protein GH714_005412 [Hevea brasiliensis]|uniref:Uncharacterized protein n=1 Tax=Hevea brasiliensis TaxID=3981 RepID=A0A6A6LE42_HEVBR|nr:hypothetical protein GH714_005412 [Hevea brasiliensis]
MVKSWYWVALDMLQPVDAPSTYASPVNKVWWGCVPTVWVCLDGPLTPTAKLDVDAGILGDGKISFWVLFKNDKRRLFVLQSVSLLHGPEVNICKLPSGENLENALGMALANCWYFGGQLSSYVWSFIPGDGNRCTRFNKYCIGDVSEFAWIEEAPDNVAFTIV